METLIKLILVLFVLAALTMKPLFWWPLLILLAVNAVWAINGLLTRR